jgi:hypothetical protein
VRESRRELRPRCALATFDFDVFGDELPFATIKIAREGIASCFYPKTASTLTIR